MHAQQVRRLLDRGAFAEALATLAAVAPQDPAASLLAAEVHERHGDMLWFHDRPGSGAAYRAAMRALLPGPGCTVGDAAEAAARQESWSRVATKALHGTGPDGRRRPGATGEPHPLGDPPHQPPAEPPPEPAAMAVVERAPITTAPIEPEPELEPEPQVTTHHLTPTADPTASRPQQQEQQQPPPVSHPADRGPLRVGHRYRIIKPFRDFDGTDWAAGTVLVFQGSDYFPHDDGLKLWTDRGPIRLCGLLEADAAVMARLDAHFAAEPHPPAREP